MWFDKPIHLELSNYMKTKIAPIAFGLLSIVALFGAISWGFFMKPSATLAQDDVTIVALGDSLTSGTGATDDNDWVSVVSRWSNIPIINAGVSGDTSEEALDRLSGDVLSRNPDIVIIFLGGNDILQDVDLDDTIDNIGEIIDQVKEDEAVPILVATHGEVFSSQREDRFDDLAEDKDIPYVPDVLEGILGRPALMDDLVHPNDDGYRIISERIWDVLVETLNEEFEDAPLSVSCEAMEDEAFIDESIEWRAFVWGGAETGEYDFDWDIDEDNDADNEDESDDDDTENGSETEEVTYTEPGQKQASVTVQSGSDEETAQCRALTVIEPQLVGLCEVKIRVRSNNDEPEAHVTFHAEAAGADGEYTFRWTGDDLETDESDDDDSDDDDDTEDDGDPDATGIYTTSGRKEATVTIESGSQNLTLTCGATVTEEMLDDDEDADSPLVGSCSVDPGSFSTEEEVEWSAQSSGGESNNSDDDDTEEDDASFEWGGSDGLSGDEDDVEKTYDEQGTKTGSVTIERNGQEIELSCQIELANEAITNRRGGGGGGGCFIATAAFGTEMEPEVMVLRRFRDEKLLTSDWGAKFVDTYYAVSPPIADAIRESEIAKALVRGALTPVIWMAEHSIEE